MSKVNTEKENKMKIERAEKMPAAMDLWNPELSFRNRMMFPRPFALMNLFDELAPSFFNYEMPRFFETLPFEEMARERAEWTPRFEMFRKDDQFVIRAELPGMTKENIEVDVDEHFVTIKGNKEKTFEEKKEHFFRSEFTYGNFFRRLPLPEGVEKNDVKAFFKDGVLELTFAAPELATETKRIEIADAEAKTMTAGQ